MPDMEFPTAEVVTLEAGDVLALATDGVWEAVNPAEEEYGAERFNEVVRANAHRGAAAIIDAVYASVMAFADGEPLRDDFTLVIVRVET